MNFLQEWKSYRVPFFLHSFCPAGLALAGTSGGLSPSTLLALSTSSTPACSCGPAPPNPPTPPGTTPEWLLPTSTPATAAARPLSQLGWGPASPSNVPTAVMAQPQQESQCSQHRGYLCFWASQDTFHTGHTLRLGDEADLPDT